MKPTFRETVGAPWKCNAVTSCSTNSTWIGSTYTFNSVFPQIALAIGVLTSSWGVRVRRFCGFVAGGAVTQGVVGGVV